MKCVRMLADERIERIDDLSAAIVVEEGRGVYCPKKEWKAARASNNNGN